MTRTYCPNCGIKFNEPICLKCNPNGTPENRFAKAALGLIAFPVICLLFAAPFLFDESELAMIRDAVLLPMLALIGMVAAVGGGIAWFLVVVAGLNSRNARLK